jgi:hypothetical protein
MSCNKHIQKDLVSVNIEITGKGKMQHRDNSLDDCYFAKLRVTNLQDSAISFCMYTCSWYDNWIFNNDSFKFCALGCDKNVFETFTLEPLKSIVFYCGIKANSTTIKRFKMGFVPLGADAERKVNGNWVKFIKSQKAYWSNEIDLAIQNNSYMIEK